MNGAPMAVARDWPYWRVSMKFEERWKEFLKTANKPELFDDGDRLMTYMGYVWGVRGWGVQLTDFRRSAPPTLPQGGSVHAASSKPA
jgi:hypothetical protein